jgi:hypothetical protein
MPPMTSQWKWSDIDLSECSSTAPSEVPDTAGIYIWRVKVGADLDPYVTTSDFIKLLQEQLERPTGVLPKSLLGTTVQMGEIAIGGGKLSPEKTDFISEQYGTHQSRTNMMKFCQTLDQFAPVVYVGKSLNLKTRISQHLQGQTDLKDYVYSALHRQWKDLYLSYLELPKDHVSEDQEVTNRLLGVLEMVAQLALAPHGVKRKG